MSETVLSATAVDTGYGHVRAIRDFSLDVRAGEVVALLGPNGAGKTTALLAMVGLLPLMSGEVTVLGEPVVHGRTHTLARRGCLLVPDDRGIFFGLTMREHLRLARPSPDPDREALVLDRFPQLKALESRKAGLMSGGEQQMLAIAKALLAEPRVLLIDELSLGLAPRIVQDMLPAVRDLAVQEGIGVVLVEQHMDLALSIADTAVVLNHGDVALRGPAAELRRDRQRVEDAYFGVAQAQV